MVIKKVADKLASCFGSESGKMAYIATNDGSIASGYATGSTAEDAEENLSNQNNMIILEKIQVISAAAANCQDEVRQALAFAALFCRHNCTIEELSARSVACRALYYQLQDGDLAKKIAWSAARVSAAAAIGDIKAAEEAANKIA
jgi:late competence protein required for DNA uptake (superfamily II DNA/RNA helicase)